ncbi:CPBP family glutamic-type intramembrane protease [Promicromonospora xylanilytica]
MQRTNPRELRAALLFSVIVLAAITAICGTFVLVGAPIPDWFVIVGRWLPALVTLVVLRVVPLPGGIAHWWGLRPGGWRRFLAGALAGVVILLAVYAAAALIAGSTGLATLLGGAELITIAAALPVAVVLLTLSTFGEEVAWRAFLQRALSPWGFWRSSTTIALVWVAFHVPLHGAMALQGTLPWSAAISSTLLLLPLGILLSALVVRWGSVWPAVLAHALPLTALNLLAGPGHLELAPQLAITAISGVLMLGAAALVAPRSAGRPAPS